MKRLCSRNFGRQLVIEMLEHRVFLSVTPPLAIDRDLSHLDESRIATVGGVDTEIPLWIPDNRLEATKASMERITTGSGDVDDQIALTMAKSRDLIDVPDLEALPEFSTIDGRLFSTVVIDGGIDPSHPFFGPDANLDGTQRRPLGCGD